MPHSTPLGLLRSTIAILWAAAGATAAAPTDWYVDILDPGCSTGTGGPSDPFCDINDALGVAQDGDVIHVAAGTYVERLVVSLDLKVQGAGATATLVDGANGGSVLQVLAGSTVTLEDLTLKRGNVNTKSPYYGGGVNNAGTLTLNRVRVEQCRAVNGGGLYNAGALTLSHCTISGNEANGYDGGGIKNRSTGTVTMSHCLVIDNYAYYYGGGIQNLGTMNVSYSVIANNSGYTYYGGGIQNSGTVSLVYSSVVDNHAGGLGGGIDNSGVVLLINSTIAGNSAWCGAAGVSDSGAGNFVATHAVIAGNQSSGGCGAPDFGGTLNSAGYNLIGNSQGTTIIGDPTGNLLDVDPAFSDPASGDYTLGAGSPALDAGDPARPDACAYDLDGAPRIIDGDLDRVLGIDMGAWERVHGRLHVTGNATPGGTLTIAVTGTPGLRALLWIGSLPGQLLFPRYGCLFVDLGTPPVILLGLGTIPTTPLNGTIPANTPPGTPIALQVLALALGPGAGNFTNPVFLTVQ